MSCHGAELDWCLSRVDVEEDPAVLLLVGVIEFGRILGIDDVPTIKMITYQLTCPSSVRL